MALADRMRADLTLAMRAREKATVRVLRSTLSALANAEAQPGPAAEPASLAMAGGVAGATDGLASTEVTRRLLSDEQVTAIVTAEREERLVAAADLDARGAAEPAASLREEAALLDRYL